MNKNPVNWFEIPVRDLDRAQKFYETVFAVSLNKMGLEPFEMLQWPMDDNSYGAAGTLVKGEGYTPSREGALVYFSVDDIEATLAKVVQGGGKILLPKMSIGEYGFVGQFEDSEGNRIALHSMI